MDGLKRTPLFPLYGKYGAKTVDFGGWELPVQFAGIQAEHDAVRTKAGLFDVSHMGEVIIAGSDAQSFLQRLTTNDVAKLTPGDAQYSLMCYPDGGVVDDLLVYKLDGDSYMLVINASNIDKDLEWIRTNIGEDETCECTDISDQTSLLALQGPLAEKLLQPLTDAALVDLKPFRFIERATVAGVPALLSRTGYTGEDGFEMYVNKDDAAIVWEKLLDAGSGQGLLPAGLGARDTLRFEARLPLYGQELSAGISPIEAGLGFFVKTDKGEFIGRAVLAEQKKLGPPRKLIGIEMQERGIARSHYPVYSSEGRLIGEVTTGTQSPTFKTNIALALIETAYAGIGGEVLVEIRGKRLKAQIVNTPFYSRPKV